MQSPKLLSSPCPCWDSPKQEIDVKMGVLITYELCLSRWVSFSPHPPLTFHCPRVENHLGAFRAQDCLDLGMAHRNRATAWEKLQGGKASSPQPLLQRKAPSVTQRLNTPTLIRVGPPARSATSEQRQDEEPGQAGGHSPPSPRHAPRQPGDSGVSPRFEGSAAATARLAAGRQS